MDIYSILSMYIGTLLLWQFGLLSFQGRDTKLAGIYRWRIVLADSEGFQQSVSASATEVRGQMQNL